MLKFITNFVNGFKEGKEFRERVTNFVGLVDRVRKIDSNAATRLIKHSESKEDFYFSGRLHECFVWADSAEGHVYWERIARILGEI